MEQSEMLAIMKSDLQMTTTANDQYLGKLLQLAQKLIEKEGIILEEANIEHQMIKIQYAAYLFRRRAASVATMPRFLRYELNNLLISQKGKANDI